MNLFDSFRERYVAARIDRSTTTISTSAQKLFDGR